MKTSPHYFYVAGIIPGAVLAAILFGLFVRSPIGISQGAREVGRLYDQKIQLTRTVGPPRLIIIGGSSALYSVRADVLERETGLPSINFGTHAGMQLAYTLHRVKSVLRRGDVAILALEYQQYAYDGVPNQLVAEFVLAFDRSFLAGRSLIDRLHFYLGISLERRILTLLGAIKDKESWELTRHGDAAFNQTANRKRHQARAVRDAGPLQVVTEGIGASQAWSELEAFISWCKEKNVLVVVTFQPMVRRPEHLSTRARAVFDRIRLFFADREVPMLADPFELAYPIESFFDSAHHLTREAADVHTRRLIPSLRKVLAEAGYDEHFDQSTVAGGSASVTRR